jgi:hypothetical protein
MEKTHEYGGNPGRFEGVIAVLLMAAWSVSTIVLVGIQNGAVA